MAIASIARVYRSKCPLGKSFDLWIQLPIRLRIAVTATRARCRATTRSDPSSSHRPRDGHLPHAAIADFGDHPARRASLAGMTTWQRLALSSNLHSSAAGYAHSDLGLTFVEGSWFQVR
jgi:hypothetical protein